MLCTGRKYATSIHSRKSSILFHIFHKKSQYMTSSSLRKCQIISSSYCQLSKIKKDFLKINQRHCCDSSPSSSQVPSNDHQTKKSHSAVNPFKFVHPQLKYIYEDICQELECADELLNKISSYFFDGNGKSIRPTTVLLMSNAVNKSVKEAKESKVLTSQRQIAMISEMIHTSSLLHDDIIDKSSIRRGKTTVNNIWGTENAVLVGDYIISVAAAMLARIRNEDVVTILSQVLVDLVQGEFMQLGSKEDEGERFTHYFNRIYRKTASLFANSCKAVTLLAGANEKIQEDTYQFGRNLGIAFQLTDDILDFESSDLAMGKPTSADLKLGVATAPVLFACEKYPELHAMIMRRFSEPNDVQFAQEAVFKSGGLQQSYMLAQQHANLALQHLECLQDSMEKSALCNLVQLVVTRKK